MNYIYDITLNFNLEYYDFYEWDSSDDITLIKKIPIFYVDNDTYLDIYSNIVSFDLCFIKEIENKTEYYFNNTVQKMTSFLLTDSENVMAIKIDEKILYSSLQINDELDILEDIKMDIKKIDYKVIKKRKNYLKTRNEVKQIGKVKKIIDNLLKEKDKEKIKYLYYECFNKKEDNIDVIKDTFKNKIDENIVLKLDNILSHHT